MNAEARQTLRELRSLGNIQTYLRTAKAELASDPCDERLRAFIDVVEGLLAEEKANWLRCEVRLAQSRSFARRDGVARD